MTSLQKFNQFSVSIEYIVFSQQSLNWRNLTDMTKYISYLKQRCTIYGWIHSIRKQKNFTFMNVNDGSSSVGIQALLPSSQTPKDLNYHSPVKITGEIVESSHASHQKLEMHVSELVLLNAIDLSDYPFSPRKNHSCSLTRGYPHLRAKTKFFSSVLRIRNALSRQIHEFFQNRDFLEIQTPILTSNDAEGGGETFSIRPSNDSVIQAMKKNTDDEDSSVYFDKNVYLSVSGQLHLEAMANGIAKVYNFSPAFRAEMGRTRRHLSEFTMIEAEVAFLFNIEELNQIIESLLRSILSFLLENQSQDLEKVEHLEKVLSQPFVRMSYSEALDTLLRHEKSFNFKPKFGEGFAREHEVFLTKSTGERPVFIVEWPPSYGPFYALRSENLSQCVDLLFPKIGELVGGSLREYNYDLLQKSIENSKLSSGSIQWYLELRKLGASPSGGFGLGFDRLVQFVMDCDNIQDVVPFPRSPHNCKL